jgi:hypothetical protein
VERNCGKCSLCCKLNKIAALDKPTGKWCMHCKIGSGCAIYADRPDICREYRCLYLMDSNLPEYWYPLRCHMVLQSGSGPDVMIVLVDPDRPDAWRREPYNETIRGYAKALCPRGGKVLVKIGPRIHVVLPDEIVDMGICAEDDAFTVDVSYASGAPRWTTAKIAKPS